MAIAEKTELGLISVVVAAMLFFSALLPSRMENGYFILILGLLFLFQTLLRDIWLLIKQRSKPRDSMPVASCMCLESGIGFIPVIVAGILLGGGLSRSINLSPFVWSVAVALVLLAGFALKDFVFELHPFRIRRDPDHVNFVFSLNRKNR